MPGEPSDRGRHAALLGEAEAVASLTAAGYRILARNYRCPFGEIDIVAEEGEVLVFVEVKARSSLAFGLPHDAITPAKRRRLARSAVHYLLHHAIEERPYRMDVVSVYLHRGEVMGTEILRGAFSLEEEMERLAGE